MENQRFGEKIVKQAKEDYKVHSNFLKYPAKNKMLAVGFEPTRTLCAEDLKSSPLTTRANQPMMACSL